MNTLYRVENRMTWQGLWYNKDGTFNPFIKTLTNAISRDLPMGFDPQFKVNGLDWVSACDNLPDMRNWFSLEDLAELDGLGYNLYEFKVERYRNVNGHAAFAREHIYEQQKLDLSLLKNTY
jgi:hypothetical protein